MDRQATSTWVPGLIPWLTFKGFPIQHTTICVRVIPLKRARRETSCACEVPGRILQGLRREIIKHEREGGGTRQNVKGESVQMYPDVKSP